MCFRNNFIYSTHINNNLALGTITNRFNHGIGSPVTHSMIPSFSNRLSSSFTLLRKAKGICGSL